MLDLSSAFPQGLSKRRAGFQGPNGEILAAVFKHSQWRYWPLVDTSETECGYMFSGLFLNITIFCLDKWIRFVIF